MPFGVMGGDNQAQAHVQIIVNIVDFGMNVQEAGEAARVRHAADLLAAESGIGEAVRAALRQRGHVVVDGRGLMGGYQAVMIDPTTRVLMGGSDPGRWPRDRLVAAGSAAGSCAAPAYRRPIRGCQRPRR
jgi:gamma-glutamyltranspeptidase/glutathione hydrolase